MKPWIQSLLIFIAGALIGGTLTAWELHHCMVKMRDHLKNPDFIADRLSSKLGLNADQKQKVSVMVKQDMAQMDVDRQQMIQKTKALWDSFGTQLKAILTPEQQKQFDQLQAQWNNRCGKPDAHCGLGGMLMPPPPGPPPTPVGGQ